MTVIDILLVKRNPSHIRVIFIEDRINTSPVCNLCRMWAMPSQKIVHRDVQSSNDAFAVIH